MRLQYLFFIILATFGSGSKKAYAFSSTWIVSIHYIFLNDGMEKATAKEYLENEYFQIFKETPGMNVLLAERADGLAGGAWVLLFFFDSKETRNKYYPDGGFSEEINALLKKHSSIFNKFFVFFDQSKYSFVDFEITGSAKTDHAIHVVRFHNLLLKNKEKLEEAESFLTREYFVMYNEMPGINAFFGRAERGREKDFFILMTTFDSKETREKYYPDTAFTSDRSTGDSRHKHAFEKFNDFFEPFNLLTNEPSEYFILSRSK